MHFCQRRFTSLMLAMSICLVRHSAAWTKAVVSRPAGSTRHAVQHTLNRVVCYAQLDGNDMRQLLQGVTQRAISTLDQKYSVTSKDSVPEKDTGTYSTITSSSSSTSTEINYGQNPTVTTTALAHSLWPFIVRPDDIVLDATAGNGHDSLQLAKLLFSDDKSSTINNRQARLVCIDTQPEACESTRQRLQALLPLDVMQNQIEILCQSHEFLPASITRLGLAVYNLGYLPGVQQGDTRMTTQTTSTLRSLAHVAQRMRVGGMISVMTYPKTNRHEHFVVHSFMAALALFSSRTDNPLDYWQRQDTLSDDDQSLLRESIQDVPASTWRVHEHAKLGWQDAPVLLTATRIQ